LGQKIIDLTLRFESGKRGVSFKPALTIAENGFNTTDLLIYSHALTHMDAPKHFISGGHAIDTTDLTKCMGPAIVVDVAHVQPNAIISVADVERYADQIIPGCRVLLRTDWDLHADQDDYRTHFPRIGSDLARWFVERGVWLLGVETPSVASLDETRRDELTTVHRILLAADIVIVESLCNLRELPEKVNFIALPLKLHESDGSPVRAVAIVE